MPGPEPDLEIAPVGAAALLLVDGLGSQLLREYAADAPFLAGLPDAGPLPAGFPSSTSISLASLGTGLPPGAHGMVGISFRAGPGELLDSLHWTSHGTGRRRDLRERLPPEDVQAERTAFERAAADGIEVRVVSQQIFAGSGLTRAALRGGGFRGTRALGDLAAEMIDAVAGPGRQLCYGYHADLDAIGHLHGPGSTAWRLQLAQIDRLAALIAERLPPDALLAITGDHGMVLVDRRYDADTDADLLAGVALLGGDAAGPARLHRAGRRLRGAGRLAGGAGRRRPGWCRASRRWPRAGSGRWLRTSGTASGTSWWPPGAPPPWSARWPSHSSRHAGPARLAVHGRAAGPAVARPALTGPSPVRASQPRSDPGGGALLSRMTSSVGSMSCRTSAGRP